MADAGATRSGLDDAARARIDGWRAQVDGVLATVAAEQAGADAAAAAFRYALAGGGKRLRPVLCLAAAEAVRPAAPDEHAARARAAAAIEMIHTYSLVHDDLPCMDDDDLRRGRPTAHRVHGSRAAMLAGFALIPTAVRELDAACAALGLDAAARTAAVAELCAGAGAAGMVGGQVLDLEAEGAPPALEHLLRIHRMKTGALFRAALRIGGMLAGATGAALDALGAFGDGLGLAFQVTDDVLDATADAAALGKTPGKDLDASKVTFVSLLGVEGARRRAREEADAAVRRLRDAGLRSGLLAALAGFAVDRDR